MQDVYWTTSDIFLTNNVHYGCSGAVQLHNNNNISTSLITNIALFIILLAHIFRSNYTHC